MSEQVQESDRRLSEPIEQLLREIQQTPREYWPNLLQIIRLFRESVTMKPSPSDVKAKVVDEVKKVEPAQQHKALSELLRKWEEEGDEQEQTETAEYLRRVLDEDRLSNRPLFP